jgi:predicted RNA-binding protein YlqC (UPF0109 family)
MNTDAVKPLIDLLSPIIRGICAYPEDCAIEPVLTAARDHIKVHPHMADIPKLIGKDGAIVNALDRIAQRAGAAMSLNARIELVQEPEKGQREADKKIDYNPAFKDYMLCGTLKDVASAMAGCGIDVKPTRFSKRLCMEIYPDERGALTEDDVIALDAVFKAYGRAQGAGKVEVECYGVEVPSWVA